MKLKLLLLTTLALFTPLTASAQEACVPLGSEGEKVCYSGVFPANPIVIELGQPIRLPVTVFRNLTNRRMAFTIEWAGLDIGGSGALITLLLDPGEWHTLADLAFEIDGLDLGTRRIAIGFGAVGGDYQISTERQFDLTIVMPGQLREIIQVPLRYCVIEGSPQALGRKPGETVDGQKLLSVLRQAADEIWLPQAGILFRHGFAPQGIPVVADPEPTPTSSIMKLGDVTTHLLGNGEWGTAAHKCEQAWNELYPGQRGVIVVNARKVFSGTDAVGGIAPTVPYELWVKSNADEKTGSRGDALCGNPRALLAGDVTPMLMTATYDPALFKVYPYVTDTYEPSKVVAHELGHTLMLGHGNGLDDNADGLLPPTNGIRRFDQYCDPLGAYEDSLGCSVMQSGDCKTISPLQRELTRAAAKHVPGAVLADPVAALAGDLLAAPGPCPADCDVPLTVKQQKIEMADTPGAEITNFSHTVLEHPQGGTHSYWVYADLDNNAATGCPVSEPGRPEFGGAELRTLVTVNSTGTDADATPTVWQCTAGAWMEVQDPGVRATAYGLRPALDDTVAPSGGIVTIQMPNAVRGPAGKQVRVQAVAEGESTFDLLPASGTGGVISLVPPDLPTCSAGPMVAKPGQIVSITANRMPASRMADVFIADAKLGSGSIGANGSLTLDVVVPATAQEGVRPVEVVVQNGAASASCALLIKGSAVTPATTATLTPEPNVNGWNNANVTVALNAVDMPGGTGIATVSYSATGAQTIALTPVTGASTSIPINVEGQTTIAYYATSNSGVTEAAHNVTVSLDKTLPAIAYAGNQGTYGVLDTVSITCTASDSLSGLLLNTCADISGPAWQFSLTGNTFTATAMDFASNVNTATASFNIVATYADLCTLTRQFLDTSNPDKRVLGESLCAKLGAAEAAAARGNANAKRNVLDAYIRQLKATVPNFLTQAQVEILSTLAAAL